MKNTLGNFFLLLKNIFIDIFFLYKSFFHWNISKLLIFFAACIIGFLLSLPFFVLLGILAFIDPIEWVRILSSDTNIYVNIANNLVIHPFYLISEVLLFGLGMAFLLLGISYRIVLESRLYLSYLKKEKLPYKNNSYFHPSKVYTYLGILSWILMYLSLPIIVLVLVFLVLFIAYSFFFLPEVILSIILFIVLLACIVWFLYLSYRLTFSYFIFMDEDHYETDQRAKFYVKKSFEKTAGKVVFQFLGVFIIFAALLSPFSFVNVSIDNDIKQIRDYFSQDYFGYETGQLNITDENKLGYYDYLRSTFSDITDEQLVSDLRGLYTKQAAYAVFFFLFVSGIFTMVLASFYKRALHLQWGKIKGEDKIKAKKDSQNKKLENKTKKKTKKKIEHKEKPEKKSTKKKVQKKKTIKKKMK